MTYCYKCGTLLEEKFYDEKGKESPDYIKIEYHCPFCGTSWDSSKHEDALKNLIERVKKIEEVLGI